MEGFGEEIRVGAYALNNVRLLAEGGFGLVYSASDRAGTSYVLKKCSIQRQEEYNIVKKEVQILDKFRDCTYIVNMVTSQVGSGSREGLILLEMCNGGHLLDKLNATRSQNTYLDQRHICTIFGQILTGIRALHEAQPVITNRDIKLENVLFGGPDNSTVKLCDFGSCIFGAVPVRNQTEKADAEEVINKETTPAYRAPEMVDLYMRPELTFKTDIWALGCLLYCLCYCTHPFQEGGSLATLNGISGFPSSPQISQDLQTLIMRMCDIDPEARPTTAELMEAVRAITQGQSLPPYSLSADALQLRAERQAQAAKRAEKDELIRKKTAERGQNAILAKRKEGQGKVVGGSVAARRLAQMRGVGQANTAEGDFGGKAFDAFNGQQGGMSDPFDTPTSVNGAGDVFTGQVPSAPLGEGFDSGFGGSNGFDAAPTSLSSGFGDSNGFDSFGNAGTVNTTSSSSDPFANTSAATSAHTGIDGVFGSPKYPGTGTTAMDAYFNAGTSGTTNTSAATKVGESRDIQDLNKDTGFGTGDFDNFDDVLADSAASNGGDPFGTSSSGDNDVFGSTTCAERTGDPFAQENNTSSSSSSLPPGESFSEFDTVPETPSRPLSEAFGSMSMVPEQEQLSDPFQRPPSGAFSPRAAQNRADIDPEASAGTADFDAFPSPSSRPVSGTFDEFSSLPPVDQSADFGDDQTAAAAFNSLPSAPPTPHSSVKFAESPIPVARPVVATPVSATPTDTAVQAVAIPDGTPAGGAVGATANAGFGVDELHNLTVGGVSPVSSRRGSSANVPSGPPPLDPFEDAPPLVATTSPAPASAPAPAHSRAAPPPARRNSVPSEISDMDADLFGDTFPRNSGNAGSAVTVDNLMDPLRLQQQAVQSPPAVAPPMVLHRTTALNAFGKKNDTQKSVMLPGPHAPVGSSGGIDMRSNAGTGMKSPCGQAEQTMWSSMGGGGGMSLGAMNMPAPQALLGKQNSYGRGQGLSNPGGSAPIPQIPPIGMTPGNMSQGMPATNMDGQSGMPMLGPGMKAPPAFGGGGGLPVNYMNASGSQFESAQPLGMAIGGNFDQSFSPQPSPQGSRPNSMTFPAPMSPADSRPPSQQMPHNPTRGFTNSASNSQPRDPFDALASFK